MNLILEFYSVSIVSMYQIFSAHKGTQRSNFETPSLINPKKKTSFLFKVKKRLPTRVSSLYLKPTLTPCQV